MRTKVYDAPVVASDTTLRLADGGSWMTCELEAVVVKGSAQPLRVFEVLDGEPDDGRRAGKAAEIDEYSRALAAFRAGSLKSAAERFASLRGYAVAGGVFVERCGWYLRQGLPDGWDGVTPLEFK
jgi:hypothetical protein